LPLWNHACKYRREGVTQHALDNLYTSAGFVGAGNGHLLHRRRTASHFVGDCVGHHGDAPDSGTQSYLANGRGWRLGNGLLLKVAGDQKHMPLINIVIALIVVGVALWLINNFIPMAGSIKTILNVVVVVAVAIWVLQAVGMWGRVTSYRFTQ
jgi:hypothetical protein